MGNRWSENWQQRSVLLREKAGDIGIQRMRRVTERDVKQLQEK